MSVPKNGKTRKKVESKPLTASQLFDRYMRKVEKVRVLAKALAAETQEAEHLAQELNTRFGVQVTRAAPIRKSAATQPLRNDDGDDTPAEFETPHQGPMTADAPRLSARESSEVAEIRREAGLTEAEQADADKLAQGAGQAMSDLLKSMGGRAAIIPSPGAVHTGRTPDPGPDNSQGGPVEQKPTEED